MTRHVPDHEVELYRTDDAYEVCLHLPDYAREDIEVRWHDGRLHVSAAERGQGSSHVYNRHLSLPHRIDGDAITAAYSDGVLEVRLPVLAGRDPPGTQIDVE